VGDLVTSVAALANHAGGSASQSPETTWSIRHV
jgi:hypothetical protein